MEISIIFQVKHLRTKYKVLDIEVDGGVGIPTIEAAAQVHISNDLKNEITL